MGRLTACLPMSLMKRHCTSGFVSLLGNIAKEEKHGPLLLNTYTVLGTSQSALYKLIIAFVLHRSPRGHKESDTAEQLS